MGFFNKQTEPIFLKTDSSAKEQLRQLEELLPKAPAEIREKIEDEIKMVRAGIYGEEQIEYELKNSHMPIIVLHDLYIKHGDLSAQIDYLVVGRKLIYLIECKNLIGNIEIGNNGEFTRTFYYSQKRYKKEGIYSPVTQNRRHLELLKQILAERKSPLVKILFHAGFDSFYKGVVVLANPKSVLNAKFAKQEVKKQVIRADQLIDFLREAERNSKYPQSEDKEMKSCAEYYLSLHQENKVDYAEKFRKEIELYEKDAKEQQEVVQEVTEKEVTDSKEFQKRNVAENKAVPLCPRCGAPMILRTATKGANAGKQFYGCAMFPKCRGIINIQK